MMGSLGWTFGSPRRLRRAERLAGLGGRVVGRDGRIGRLRLPGMLGRWFRWRDLPAPARAVVPGVVAEVRVGGGRAMSADARTEILDRIRAAFPTPSPVEVPRDYRRSIPADVDVVERFAERVADYRATVHRSTGSDLAATVAAALARRGARRLVVPAGVPEAWLEAADIERLADDPPLSKADLDAADGVITGCAVAIAETGTIVLDAGPGQGRRVLSLLPDYHLCVVEAAHDRRERPGGPRAARPAPAADVDQRPVGDERHRAPAGRGRPRPAESRGRDRLAERRRVRRASHHVTSGGARVTAARSNQP